MYPAYGATQVTTEYQRLHDESSYTASEPPPSYEEDQEMFHSQPSAPNLPATKGATDTGLPQTNKAQEGQQAEKSCFGRNVASTWETIKKFPAKAGNFLYSHQPSRAICQFTVLAYKGTCILAKGSWQLLKGTAKVIAATPDFIENDLSRVVRETKIRGKAIAKRAAIAGAAGGAAGAAVSVAIMGPSALIAGPLGVVPAAVPTMLGLTAGIAGGAVQGYYEGIQEVHRDRQARLPELPVSEQPSYEQDMSAQDMQDYFADAHCDGDTFEVIFKEGVHLMGMKEKFA